MEETNCGQMLMSDGENVVGGEDLLHEGGVLLADDVQMMNSLGRVVE